MSEYCENLEKCGFFKNFKGNTEVIKNSWIRMFCQDIQRSLNCKRKEIKKQTGNPPADNMAPTGKLL